ncbi:hypothetical protein Bca52824_033167 [Brassica carinata]|uniref:Uncharacterized protein n=1 Tax=Brassica carinata TaxID=52824 RepID=A0A8X7V886_BRACI|nr:hypothetical protein Bca52824_033167 [Brassica carinata]
MVFEHPNSAAYPDDFFRSVRAVAALRVHRWADITVEKICGLADRVARKDWSSDLPSIPPSGTKRLSIFPRTIQKIINQAREMDAFLDLSAVIAAQLGLPDTVPLRSTTGTIGEEQSRPTCRLDRPSDLVAEQPEADSRKEAPDHDPQIHEKDVVPATVENDVTVHVLSDNSPLSQRDQSIEERDPGHIGANPSGGQTESQFAGERTGETSENVDEGASATTGGTRISPTAEGRQDCESSVRASELSDLNDHSSAPGN